MSFLRRAFTLLEMLIALVVIGIVISVLLGVFASPVGKAKMTFSVSSVKDDFRMISDAQNLFFSKWGAWGTPEELLSDGLLKAWPTPPQGIFEEGCLAVEGADPKYDLWVEDLYGGALKDFVVVLPCVSEEFAHAYDDGEGTWLMSIISPFVEKAFAGLNDSIRRFLEVKSDKTIETRVWSSGVVLNMANDGEDDRFFVITGIYGDMCNGECLSHAGEEPVDSSLAGSTEVLGGAAQGNLNLWEAIGRPTGCGPFKVRIAAGSIAYSTNPSVAAVTSGNFSSCAKIYLVNRGRILGAPGQGATRGTFNTIRSGGTGGHAIDTIVDMTIINEGDIWGGGGGGGQGNNVWNDQTPGSCCWGGSGGWGNGYGHSSAGNGGAIFKCPDYQSRVVGYGRNCGVGGRGGDWGHAGSAGVNGGCFGDYGYQCPGRGSGGAAGRAVNKRNGASVVISGGSIKGAV